MLFGMRGRTWAVIAVAVLTAVAGPSLSAAEPVSTLQADDYSPSVAFAPNGKTLACGLVLRDAVSGKVLGKGDPGNNYPGCTCVAFSPDGRRMAAVHFERGLIRPPHALFLWDVTAENQVRKAATLLDAKDQPHLYQESLHYLTFSPDGRMLATRLPGDRTVVWETASGQERLRLDTHGLAVAFAADGRTLTAVSRTGLVQHWDLATGKCADAQREDFLFVCNAVASADGKTLAITDHHSVLLKDARTGKTLRRFDDLDTSCFALSADGTTLAVNDGGVLLLDAATGKATGRLGERKQSVGALAFSPDGKSLAVGFTESVEVWEVAALARPGQIRPAPVLTLEARVVSREETYTLAPGGKTSEEFARQFDLQKLLPASPEVDLVLTLRNTTDKKLMLDPDGEVGAYLVGDGALNHPALPYQTAFQFSEPKKKVTLAPGETYSVPIKALDQGHSQRSYWLLPGEYTLHVRYHIRVSPAPEGWYKFDDGSAFGTVRAAPLRLKIVARTK